MDKTIILCDVSSCPARRPAKLRGMLAVAASLRRHRKTIGATSAPLPQTHVPLKKIEPNLAGVDKFLEEFLAGDYAAAAVDMPEYPYGTEPVTLRRKFAQRAKLIEAVTITEEDTPEQLDALARWCAGAPIRNFCLVIDAPGAEWHREWDPLAHIVATGKIYTTGDPERVAERRRTKAKPEPVAETPKQNQKGERPSAKEPPELPENWKPTRTVHGSISRPRVADAIGVMARNRSLFYSGMSQAFASEHAYGEECHLRDADIPFPESYRFRKPKAEQDTPLNRLQWAIAMRNRSGAEIRVEPREARVLAIIQERDPWSGICARNCLRKLEIPVENGRDAIDITECLPALMAQLGIADGA